MTKRTLTPLKQSSATRRVRPDKAWAVYYPAAGRNGIPVRHRRFFRHREDAEAFCSVKRAEIASMGVKASALSDELKEQALACAELLAPIGKTLLEAVEGFIRDHKASQQSVLVGDAVDALLKRVEADGLSHRHKLTLSSVLSRFATAMGEVPVSKLTTERIQSWLDGYRSKEGQPLSPVSFNSYRRHLGLFMSFCARRGWIATNPTSGIRALKVTTKVPRLMPPSDLRKVLAACPVELRPVVAIQALCGLRIAEAARLRWEDILIKPTGNYVQIGAKNAKTARRRLTPMPQGLADYLRRVGAKEGYVCASAKGSVNILQMLMARVRQALPSVAWGKNALRASALSYRLALTKDAAATAFEMGNSPTVLMTDYRELTTPAQAEEWFAVRVG